MDEYDTPTQEAYVNGYWQELVSFTKSLFNSTFKTNPFLRRGMMAGMAALEEFGLSEEKEKVQMWYDGFSFGKYRGIYNPWSILNY